MLLLRRHTNGQQIYEKMFKFTSYQGNANQNYNEMPPHIRMAIINTISIDNKQTSVKRGYREKGTIIHCWWECKLVQPPQKTVWRFLERLKMKLPYDLAIPLLDIFLKNLKTFIHKDICTLVFIAALLSGQDMKTTKVQFDR